MKTKTTMKTTVKTTTTVMKTTTMTMKMSPMKTMIMKMTTKITVTKTLTKKLIHLEFNSRRTNQLTNEHVCDASPAKKGDRRSFRLSVKEIQKIRKKYPGKKLKDRSNLLPFRKGQMNRSVLYALLWQM